LKFKEAQVKRLFLSPLMIFFTEAAYASDQCKNTNLISVDQRVSLTDPGNSSVASGTSGAQFSTTNSSSLATIKLANEVVSKPVSCNLDNEKYTSRSWELVLSSPLNKDGTPAQFATLDRLTTGVKASFKYSKGFTSGVRKLDKPQITNLTNLLALAKEVCRKKIKGEDLASCEAPSFAIDSKSDPDEFMAKWITQEYLEQSYENSGQTIWFTGGAELGYNDFEYLDTSDLTAQTQNGIEFKVEASATYSAFKSELALSFGGAYESAFDQSDEAVVCLDNNSDLKCASGRLAPPVRKDNFLVFGEARKVVKTNNAYIPQIGIAPRITHNFDKNLTGVSVPIFLLPDDGGLSSGLQFGWRSDTDNVSAGIFVGGTFDFLQ